MSRIGTPTENPSIKSKNGWIKKEMYIDFDINNHNTVKEFIDAIVWDNNYRPSYALQYKKQLSIEHNHVLNNTFYVYFLLTTS